MTASIWLLSIPCHLSRGGLCAYQCQWDHTRLDTVLAGEASINIAASPLPADSFKRFSFFPPESLGVGQFP